MELDECLGEWTDLQLEYKNLEVRKSDFVCYYLKNFNVKKLNFGIYKSLFYFDKNSIIVINVTYEQKIRAQQVRACVTVFRSNNC